MSVERLLEPRKVAPFRGISTPISSSPRVRDGVCVAGCRQSRGPNRDGIDSVGRPEVEAVLRIVEPELVSALPMGILPALARCVDAHPQDERS